MLNKLSDPCEVFNVLRARVESRYLYFLEKYFEKGIVLKLLSYRVHSDNNIL